MKFCAAQCSPKAGAVEHNLEQHIAFIRKANEHGVDLLVFPELSLSGYEPSLATDLSFQEDDSRLRIFIELSRELDMTMLVGLPLRVKDAVSIAQLIFSPHTKPLIYRKQWLHEDEQPWFQAGEQPLCFDLKEHRITPAICYESLLLPHRQQALDRNATMYSASVAKHQAGVQSATQSYANFAQQAKMNVLMANSVGPCDNFIAAGGSAVWDTQGQCRAQLSDAELGLVGLDTDLDREFSLVL